MEFKRSPNRNNNERPLTVPPRSTSDRSDNPLRKSSQSNAPPQTPSSKNNDSFLFDDIPTSDDISTDVPFRSIFAAWAKQAFRHSPLAKRLETQTKPKRSTKLKQWKSDLKWALQADLDEPVKPIEKQPAPTHKTPVHSARPKDQSPLPTKQDHNSQADSKAIDITINFGSIPKVPLHKLRKLPPFAIAFVRKLTKKQLILITMVALVVLIFALSPVLQRQFVILTGGDPNNASSEKTNEKPAYRTLLPSGKTAADVGGWSRVSPPGSAPVFAYAETFRNVKIKVSQQPIPENFKPDVKGNIEKLAKNYVANDEIKSGSLTIYVGTSGKGPQSVIFTKNDLLILITSSGRLDDSAWASYAESLN